MNNTKLETAEKLFLACQFDRAFPLFEELAEENNSRPCSSWASCTVMGWDM